MGSRVYYNCMTLGLVGVLAYAGYSAVCPPQAKLKALDSIIGPQHVGPMVRAHKNNDAPATGDAEAVDIAVGSTRQQVFAALGAPTLIDPDDDRWIYGGHVLTFKDDRLLGCVKVDPGMAVESVYGDAKRAMERELTEAKHKASSTASGALRRTNAYAHRSRIETGSARRSRWSMYPHEGWSYYMNRSGPLYREFFRKPSLPRGMSPFGTSPQSRNPHYLPYSNSRAAHNRSSRGSDAYYRR